MAILKLEKQNHTMDRCWQWIYRPDAGGSAKKTVQYAQNSHCQPILYLLGLINVNVLLYVIKHRHTSLLWPAFVTYVRHAEFIKQVFHVQLHTLNHS